MIDRIKCFFLGHKPIGWNGRRACRRCGIEFGTPFYDYHIQVPPRSNDISEWAKAFMTFRIIINESRCGTMYRIKHLKVNKQAAQEFFSKMYFEANARGEYIIAEHHFDMLNAISFEGMFKYRGITVICS